MPGDDVGPAPAPRGAPDSRGPVRWGTTGAAHSSSTMQDLVADPATELFAPLPHGEGQTALRESLLVADHNAYHLGQLVEVRRLLGAWQEEG
jgi:hypothetical protein